MEGVKITKLKETSSNYYMIYAMFLFSRNMFQLEFKSVVLSFYVLFPFSFLKDFFTKHTVFYNFHISRNIGYLWNNFEY